MKIKEHKMTSMEKEMARSSFSAVASVSRRFSKSKTQYATIKFSDNENFIHVPKYLVQFMALILKEMAKGKTLSLVTSDTEVTTEQAATILNVSRPFVVKLLESGIIPYKKVGTHRRILLSDVENYHSNMRAKRKEALQTLSDLDQELGLE